MRISRYFYKYKKVDLGPKFFVNEQIRAPELRVIDENGEHLGVLPTARALAMAGERGFDLVEVNPTQNPPVAKILNYGQFKYEREKELKKQKQSLKEIDIKGVRLSLRIGQHDLDLRKNQALKFLDDGNKIKIEIILKGREKQHSRLAFQIIRDFIASLKKELSICEEQPPAYQGGKLTAILAKK